MPGQLSERIQLRSAHARIRALMAVAGMGLMQYGRSMDQYWGRALAASLDFLAQADAKLGAEGVEPDQGDLHNLTGVYRDSFLRRTSFWFMDYYVDLTQCRQAIIHIMGERIGDSWLPKEESHFIVEIADLVGKASDAVRDDPRQRQSLSEPK